MHTQSSAPLPTFFTLQRHSGFQVVHLHLQAFECQVAFAGLALIGDENDDDEEDEEASGSGDADDGGAAKGAVRGDMDHARGKLDATHTGLTRNTHTHTNTTLHCIAVSTQSLKNKNRYVCDITCL